MKRKEEEQRSKKEEGRSKVLHSEGRRKQAQVKRRKKASPKKKEGKKRREKEEEEGRRGKGKTGGEEDARTFYTSPKRKKGGGLGWSPHGFSQVSWASLDGALSFKPDRYSLWLSKQASGWCATRQRISRIQDLLEDKCPACQRVVETSQHLNVCPNEGRTQLFRESVELLEK